ncbi:MAG TPA: hypothetical protein VNN62_04375 [Methylomirabilota bacterium]|nr:hypothetical protein [Methylomirabilota bacterium]
MQLAPLRPVAIEQYLRQRFSSETREVAPSSLSLRELTHAIHQRTEGNPLFMVNAVEYLLAQGAILQADGQWDFHRATAHLQNSVPPSTQQLIERQIAQLRPGDQRVLEVASVVGVEFSAAAVAARLSDVIQDPGVHCRCYLAELLWLQGYADQAQRCCRQALHLASQLAHAHSQAVALSSVAILHHWLGELQAVRELAEALVMLTQKQGFPQWHAVGIPQHSGRGRLPQSHCYKPPASVC